MKFYSQIFQETISVESLFDAWNLFRKGKNKRLDVQEFFRKLEPKIFHLHRALLSKQYKHLGYQSFYIHDPKLRHIRKASVRDRIVHQVVTSQLNRIFEPQFINDLYSSRLGKGTHKGVEALRGMFRQVSRNGTQPCWALKCDIKKFYDSVDHQILLKLIKKKIRDRDFLWLCEEIVNSFHHEATPGKGLPIGNLTSQIFTNIYLNVFDQFIKHDLQRKEYVRYADDFVILATNKEELEGLIPILRTFLAEKLELDLHPRKVTIRPLKQGVDFLGYVLLKYHTALRTKTKRRMLRKMRLRHDELYIGKISSGEFNQSLQSYLGILQHADAYKLSEEVKNHFMWHEQVGDIIDPIF